MIIRQQWIGRGGFTSLLTSIIEPQRCLRKLCFVLHIVLPSPPPPPNIRGLLALINVMHGGILRLARRLGRVLVLRVCSYFKTSTRYQCCCDTVLVLSYPVNSTRPNVVLTLPSISLSRTLAVRSSASGLVEQHRMGSLEGEHHTDTRVRRR